MKLIEIHCLPGKTTNKTHKDSVLERIELKNLIVRSLPLQESEEEFNIKSFTRYIKFELEVKDYGCGINEENVKNLF